jgi:hypothetical protein
MSKPRPFEGPCTICVRWPGPASCVLRCVELSNACRRKWMRFATVACIRSGPTVLGRKPDAHLEGLCARRANPPCLLRLHYAVRRAFTPVLLAEHHASSCSVHACSGRGCERLLRQQLGANRKIRGAQMPSTPVKPEQFEFSPKGITHKPTGASFKPLPDQPSSGHLMTASSEMSSQTERIIARTKCTA